MTLTIPATGPQAAVHHSIDNLTGGWMVWQSSPGAVTAWGTANRAIYIPVRVPQTCVVLKLGYAGGTTAAGNVDLGLYDAAGVLLVSTPTTAKAAGTALQAIDVTDTTIHRGLYYIGLNNDTTTDDFACLTDAAPIPAARGILTEALGSIALPATATWAVNQTLGFIPIVSALLVTEVS